MYTFNQELPKMGVQYVVNEDGKKTGVFLTLEEYEELLERIEDSEAISLLKKMREESLQARSFDNFAAEYSPNV